MLLRKNHKLLQQPRLLLKPMVRSRLINQQQINIEKRELIRDRIKDLVHLAELAQMLQNAADHLSKDQTTVQRINAAAAVIREEHLSNNRAVIEDIIMLPAAVLLPITVIDLIPVDITAIDQIPVDITATDQILVDITVTDPALADIIVIDLIPADITAIDQILAGITAIDPELRPDQAGNHLLLLLIGK